MHFYITVQQMAEITWDIQHEQLDGIGPDEYTEIGADSYTWANPVGENIAFCFGKPMVYRFNRHEIG